MAMSEWLQTLYKRNAIRAIDRQFARFIAEQVGDGSSPIVGWAALVSFELGKGNVCVDLNALDASRLFDLAPAESMKLAAIMQPENALSLVAGSEVVGDGSSPTPMVLAGTRLYLHRYWAAEQRVAQEIVSRTNEIPMVSDASEILDALFQPDITLLRKLFPGWMSARKPASWWTFLISLTVRKWTCFPCNRLWKTVPAMQRSYRLFMTMPG